MPKLYKPVGLFIVSSKNNKTHFGRRARRPRPYETAAVKGKVPI